MKAVRPPTAVSILAVLTGAYWCAGWLLDRDPAARPLEVPYHLLRHMERDARLRSRAPADRVQPQQQFLQVWDFDTAARLRSQVVAEEPSDVDWSPAALLPDRGSLHHRVSDGGVTLALPLAACEQQPDCLQVEGRLRLLGAATPLNASLYLAQSLAAAPPRLSLGPALDLPRAAALQTGPLMRGEWWEFSVSLAGWDAVAAPEALALTLVTDAPEVEWDELVLRAAPRLHGLLAGGQPRNTGVTEGTRIRKRFVRRGQDERLCLALAPPTLLDLALEVPRFARLELGLSSLSESVPRQPTEFTVAVSREGQFEETLLRRTVGPEDASVFADHSLDLSSLAGQRVRLQLRVEAANPALSSVVLLADPVVVARPPRALPSVFLLTAPQEWLEGGEASRLLEGATHLTRYQPADRDAELDLLSLLTSQPPTTERDPTRRTGLAPRIPNLVEVLRRSGYESFAATSPDRRGPTLQGFTRRWSDASLGGDAGIDSWLEPRTDRPVLVLFDLPRLAPGDALAALKKQLVQRGSWQDSHVLLVPSGGAPGLALWRKPRPAVDPPPVHQDLGAVDLAPALLAALELPPCLDFRGSALALEEPVTAEAAGPSGTPDQSRGTGTDLRLARRLPPRFEVILDERQAAWPLPPGGPR